MTREEKLDKAIDSLEYFINAYAWTSDEAQSLGYALALLEEQAPVKPKEVKMYPRGQYACGACGHVSVGSKDYHANYCPEC